MPIAVNNNPTFTRSNQGGVSPGFYTRTLFVWSPYDQWDNLAGTDWTTTNQYDGIGNLIATKPEYCHGTNVLPAGYWRYGKQIRATGTAYVQTSTSSTIFNIQFGISLDASPFTLAAANNGANHYFYDSSTGEALVDFECLIVLSGAGIIGQGYYQYNRNTLSGTVTNRSNSYVPLWSLTNPSTGDPTSYTTKILFNFYAPTVVTTIRLHNLRLEELA